MSTRSINASIAQKVVNAYRQTCVRTASTVSEVSLDSHRIEAIVRELIIGNAKCFESASTIASDLAEMGLEADFEVEGPHKLAGVTMMPGEKNRFFSFYFKPKLSFQETLEATKEMQQVLNTCHKVWEVASA